MVNTCVAQWLNGNRNYAEGLQLLRELTPDCLTVLILESGEDEYNQNLLVEEMTGLLEKSNGWPIQVIEPVLDTYLQDSLQASAQFQHAIGLTPELTGVSGEPLPEITRDKAADIAKRLRLKSEAGQLWQEMAHVKGAMAMVKSGKALHRLARQLLMLNEKRQKLWDEIDFFEEHGYWHDEKKLKVEKPVNLEQLIKNQMSYRTKTKTMLRNPLTRSQREYQEKRLFDINQEIHRLQNLREGKA